MSNIAAVSEVKNLILITGGARSGKSAFAEGLANQIGGKVLYIATMEELSHDSEAVQRIKRHRERRPGNWQTVERPFDVDAEVAKIPPDTSVCLIDCLSLYVSNILLKMDGQTDVIEEIEQSINQAATDVIVAIQNCQSTQFIVVTNEVGWGIVPEHKLARTYRDLLGVVNQQFARAAGSVWLSCAGLQIALKS